MLPLEKKYIDRIDTISKELQESDELAVYLENEEEDDFFTLKDKFEPPLAELHKEVAMEAPLQILSLEKEMLRPEMEGMYLPRLLGYSVLRGVFSDNYKYLLPQEHFKEILLAICESTNFDILKKRIGQAIQIGFSFSSDIWVTNLISGVSNKYIKKYMASHKLLKYRDPGVRYANYRRFKRQFAHDYFLTTDFPTTTAELAIKFPELKQFLEFRVKEKLDNKSFIPYLQEFITNEKFYNTHEYLVILGLYAHFFDLDKKGEKQLKEVFNRARKEHSEFQKGWFELVMYLPSRGLFPTRESDEKIAALIDPSIKDDLADYYEIAGLIHTKGYNNEDVQEHVKDFYYKHKGLSVYNKAIRKLVFNYFEGFVSNLSETEYNELYDLSKTMEAYINIFANQQFNQNLKDILVKYLRRMMKIYPDRRGRDFQQIKKYAKSTLPHLGLMTEKEVTALFVKRRKKTPVT